MLARWFTPLAPAYVALVLAFAAHSPALRPDRRLAGRDLYTVYEPLFLRVAAAWRGEGSLLRDPLRGAGMPLLADPLAQVAYPPGWLRALLPFQLGHALLFPLHAALAGAGAGLLARRLGAGPRGACLAAAGAALAGPVLSACRTPNLLAGIAWLGFALAGLVELSQPGGGRARRGLVLAAASIALMLLGGGLELVMLLGLGCAVAALRIGRGGLFLGGAALACGLGAALAAVQLVPSVGWIRGESARGAERAVGPVEAASWAIHPLRLPETVIPGVSPGASPGLYAGRGTVRRSWGAFGHPLHASLHLGLPVVGLALLAAWRGRRRPGPVAGLALAGLAWGVLAFELGFRPPWFETRAPAFELLRALPLFDAMRYPGKAFLPLCVLLPALAGAGLRGLPARARVAAFGLTCALGLLAQRLDPAVLPTLPRQMVEEPPALARELLAGPPGRYLRLRKEARASGFEAIRAAHRDVLVEDLPTRFGIPSLLAYPPFHNRRLGSYLASVLAVKDGTLEVDEARLAREAWVAGWLPLEGPLRRLEPAPRVRLEGTGRLLVLGHEPTRIEVELALREPGGVFVSEAFEAGWSAELDAEPVPLEEAAGLFMRVPVPAGHHELVLRYRPPGLGVGAALSGLGALAALALLLAGRLRRA